MEDVGALDRVDDRLQPGRRRCLERVDDRRTRRWRRIACYGPVSVCPTVAHGLARRGQRLALARRLVAVTAAVAPIGLARRAAAAPRAARGAVGRDVVAALDGCRRARAAGGRIRRRAADHDRKEHACGERRASEGGAHGSSRISKDGARVLECETSTPWLPLAQPKGRWVVAGQSRLASRGRRRATSKRPFRGPRFSRAPPGRPKTRCLVRCVDCAVPIGIAREALSTNTPLANCTCCPAEQFPSHS